MTYVKTKDGRVVEYPDYFRELGYEVTHTPTQFSMYCLYFEKPRVVYLDENEKVLYLKDERHPHPFVKAPEDSVIEEAPIGTDVRVASEPNKLIDVFVVNTPSRKHCLLSVNEVNRLAEFPGAEGYGATWTEDGLMYVAKAEGYLPTYEELVAEAEKEGFEPPEEGAEITPRYKLRILRTSRTGSLGKKIDALDVKSIEETEIDGEEGAKIPVIRITFGMNDAIRELLMHHKDRDMDIADEEGAATE